MDLLKSPLRSSHLTFYLICVWVVLLPLREYFIDTSEMTLRRIAFSDIAGILIIISYLFKENKKSIQFPTSVANFILGTFFLVGTFSLGIFVSQNVFNTVIELVAILFLFSIYRIVIEEFNSKERFQLLIQIIAVVSFLVSVYGLIDLYFSEIYHSKSTFRNRGQAGTYMLYVITILFSYIFSPLLENHNKAQRNFIKVSLAISVVFMISTIKFAATIGLFSGFIFYLLFNKKWKVLLGCLGIFMMLFLFYESYFEHLYYLIELKIDSLKEGNFLYTNYQAAINGFFENPIFGSGLGGFHKVFHTHEVHSNYLKILATTGIVGTIGYSVFLFQVFRFFINPKIHTQDNPYKKVLVNTLPFLIGCAVSWIYTYHLRSREFWLLMIFITICYALALEETKKSSNHNHSY